VRLRREPVPPEQVDPREDGLEEERETLQREGETVDLAIGVHRARQEHPHLERQDRARYRTDGKERAHDLRPGVRQRQVVGVAPSVPARSMPLVARIRTLPERAGAAQGRFH
jgi:hypothetical protein